MEICNQCNEGILEPVCLNDDELEISGNIDDAKFIFKCNLCENIVDAELC